MRYFYTLLLYLSLPLVFLRLWGKGRRVPGYRRHWAERLGFGACRGPYPVWLHAVSVGEVRAAQPLLSALLARHPGQSLLVTTSTPGGRQTVAQLFGDRVVCAYLPYDLPGAARRFLKRVQPRMAVFMEVELWPNLYAALAGRGIHAWLVNARLSDRSWRGYRRLGALAPATLRCLDGIATQSVRDRERFIALGADASKVSVAGNLKFDVPLPDDYSVRAKALGQQVGAQRPVWLAGSTHAGEEQTLLQAHRALLAEAPDALLILAPRHPERAAGLLEACARAGLAATRYSKRGDTVRTPVLIVDHIGVLVYCYAVAGAAFVGGSLVDAGGHNPLEAILAGAPVLSGVHTGNFDDLYARLFRADAALKVRTSRDIVASLCSLFADDAARQAMNDAAEAVIAGQRGALERVLGMIGPAGGGLYRERRGPGDE